jgi:subfamily B ATP-binding cassette protein HlyB/CyaB
MIAGYYRIACDQAQIAHDLGLGHRRANIHDLVRAAKRIGLKAKALQGHTLKRLKSAPLPAILRMRNGNFSILTHRLGDDTVRLVSPEGPIPSIVSLEDAAQAWSGDIVLVTRRLGGPGDDPANFGFKWFLSSVWRYKRPFGHLLLASFFIQLFALVTPLFFQVVVDKVLVHKGGSTLVVIVAGLVFIGFFDVLLQHLRTYVLSHTASRMDVELGARLFDHLLRLPLSYFETRAAGGPEPQWPSSARGSLRSSWPKP